MTRISGRPTYHHTYLGNRTKIAHQAQRAKRLLPGGIRLQAVSAKSFFNERGSVLPEILSAILGGATGFCVGAHLQFSTLKDVISAEKNIEPEKLSFWGYLFDPVSSSDYSSIIAAGLVGLFFGGGILVLGHRIITQSDSDQQ